MFDIQILYDKNYEMTLTNLEGQSKLPSFMLEDIRKELEALYVYAGHDMEGRGELKEAEIASSIAAYEAFLSPFSD